MKWTLTSERDDSVTLVCGTLTATFRGKSWGEANYAALTLARFLDAKDGLDALRNKTQALAGLLDDAAKAFAEVDTLVEMARNQALALTKEGT
jgi:hypothetical protein